jgi:hypothetical protein
MSENAPGNLHEALAYAVSLSPARTSEIGGKTYTDKPLTLVEYQPAVSAQFSVNSLAGLVDLLEGGIDDFDAAEYFLHVVDHTQVRVVARKSDAFGRRPSLIKAEPLKGLSEYKFNQYGNAEEFVIAMLSLFVASPIRDELIGIASKINSEESIQTEDNGMTQIVSTRQGVALSGTRSVAPQWELQPYRTFRDVSQPYSSFLFRVKQGGLCALFEADGGTWKLTAINLIAQYLQNALNGSAVDALKALPIIS